MAAQDVPDLYAILGIPEDFSQDEVKRAYRQLAKEHHPDIGAEGLSPQERETRVRRMQEINEAYSIVLNPEKRKRYETLRERTRATTEGIRSAPTNIVDLFNEIFVQNSIFREDFWSGHRREEKDRGEQIRIREEGKYREDPEAAMKWNTFLGEYHLAGEGRNRLYGGLNPVPFDYGKYLGALKSLARKIAYEEYDENGNIDIRAESKIINSYGEFNSKGRVEGKLLWADDESREWVRKVPLNKFWARLKTAEGTVVQVEGAAKTEESQQKQPEVESRKPETPEGFSPSSGEAEGGYS